MDQQDIHDIMSGRRRHPGAGALRWLLLMASWPYGWAAGLRRWCYRRGALPQRSAGVPVISVGNVTAGGTGKTPMAAWVAGRLAEAGAKPAIIMRGYRPAAGISDEAELLRRLAGCPVVANADRVAAAGEAVAHGADVLVVDDGFQHLRLRRDVDIVLVDAMRPFGYGHCLPRGLLREPLWVLAEADAVVITRSDAVGGEQLRQLRRHVAHLAPKASVHLAAHRPLRIEDRSGNTMPPEHLAGKKAGAFCGIGNAEAFFDLLSRLGVRLVWRRAFDDHVKYGPQAIRRIRQEAAEAKPDVLVTTQKDFVKLAAADLGVNLWQLVVEMRVTEGETELVDMAVAAWRAGRQPIGKPA